MNKKVFLFDWGNTLMKDFPDEKGPMYSWNKVMIMPDTDKMLNELYKTADCYIATNARDSNKEDIIKALRRVHIDHFIKDIFCYKEIGFPKPSKEYFSEVFKRLNTDIENVTMVGDSLENDISGAVKFGFNAVLFDPENKYSGYHGLKISKLTDLLIC